MHTFTNDKGEEVIIAEMDKHRLIHSIAKYAKGSDEQFGEVVKALKTEAVYRISGKYRIIDLMNDMEEEGRDDKEEPNAESKAIYKGLELALEAVNKKSNLSQELSN